MLLLPILYIQKYMYVYFFHAQVLRNDERTTLTVDGVSQSKDSRGKEFQFGKFATNSDVFIGGMPNWYNAKLALLALPSVIFEPRFRGSVRNLVYADAPNVGPRRQEQRAQRDIKCGDLPCEGNELPNKEKVARVSMRVLENDTHLMNFLCHRA